MLQKGSLIALATVLLAIILPGEGKADLRDEINCLALNIYFEARGEPVDGKIAVGHVVLNRVADARYPDKICEVVKQGGPRPRHRCQFSWWCDGRSDRPRDLQAWKESQVLARVVFWGYAEDPTGGALWYHADYALPTWRRKLARGPMIGRHQFYVPGNPRLTRAEPKPSGDELTSAVRAFKEAPAADGVRDEAIGDGGRAI
ncbi:MAG: cell wall hydrolase [Alphaproteobacteria bacterium]|nr:cell wall hydrolase [Alphaproteobacteria bacterium]